ncbi:MAG: hypothetical protein ACXWYN_06900, partial [Actinomycetota bacterium]
AEVEILLAEGDRETALAKATQLLALERERSQPKDIAAGVWWVGSVFGVQEAGGAEEVERARALLESFHWEQALRRPELLPERL